MTEAEQERADVVAWLRGWAEIQRKKAMVPASYFIAEARAIEDAADAIERCYHLTK